MMLTLSMSHLSLCIHDIISAATISYQHPRYHEVVWDHPSSAPTKLSALLSDVSINTTINIIMIIQTSLKIFPFLHQQNSLLSALLLLDVSINITFNIITTIQTSWIIRFLHQPNPLLSALLSDVTPDCTTVRFTQTQIIIILLLLVGITMLKCGDNVFLHWRMVITTI